MKVALEGKVAVVTGGAQGIGRAIVDALVNNGAQVAIVDIDKEAGKHTATEIQQSGGTCLFVEGDVSNASEMGSAADQIAAYFGKIEILVNNAGINTRSDRVPIHQYTFEDWQRILEIDLTGVFATSRAVIPHILAHISAEQDDKSGSEDAIGRIVNISSIAGLVPLRLQSAYVAAKAGVANLTRSMALELGPEGILVNAVAPGSTLTRGTEALFYGDDGAYTENAASLLSHIPLGRPGRTTEIAAAVLFLVSPDASYINGNILTVDGGWTAGYTRDW
ncbi:SDR family oxidoreductase [Candidatus Poribacteria bacterium]|nr:SDR family oxidoreductase [Candidatus Poribacteria bacterium]